MTSTKTSSSKSSSSSMPKRDVFLSFTEETRKSFTDHLYYALNQKRINTFKEEDREIVERGRDILQATLEAIEESRFAIVVLSKNYASSTWCLDQLAKIVTCKKELGLRDVHPVFYHVDRTHVREQTGDFGNAFQQIFKDNTMEKVNQWREVLTQVANLPGWDLQNKHESNFIQEIVKNVSEKLNPAFEDDDNNLLVGMDSRINKMYSLLDMERLDDVRTIGIWGLGGIGKTTIAREAFKRLSHKFEASAFVANVRERFGNNGISIHLQECLHQHLWGIKDELWNDFMRINLLKNAMRSKRVLIILDDVDSLKQIEDSVGDWRKQSDWLGAGSRVIVTTRNKHLLRRYGEKYIYEVDKLSNDEALQLLCQEAPFKEDKIPDKLKVVFKDLVEYADGHPLALNKLVDNSFLEWSDSLAELKEIIFNEYLVDIFKASFDGLDGEEKEIFLEIASFFNGEDRYGVEKKLQGYPKISIQVLTEKSLIAMVGNKPHMHNLLQKFGLHILNKKYSTTT